MTHLFFADNSIVDIVDDGIAYKLSNNEQIKIFQLK